MIKRADNFNQQDEEPFEDPINGYIEDLSEFENQLQSFFQNYYDEFHSPQEHCLYFINARMKIKARQNDINGPGIQVFDAKGNPCGFRRSN